MSLFLYRAAPDAQRPSHSVRRTAPDAQRTTQSARRSAPDTIQQRFAALHGAFEALSGFLFQAVH
eukprot:7311884-Alexandrium_andersonii.AAC.1